jgi:hypothetical protein
MVGPRHHGPGDVVEVADDARAIAIVGLGHAEFVTGPVETADAPHAHEAAVAPPSRGKSGSRYP